MKSKISTITRKLQIKITTTTTTSTTTTKTMKNHCFKRFIVLLISFSTTDDHVTVSLHLPKMICMSDPDKDQLLHGRFL